MNAQNATQPSERLTVRGFGLGFQPDGSGNPAGLEGVLTHHDARTRSGHRLLSVVTDSGDTEWYACCLEHRWLSIGGSLSTAEWAGCPGCEAEQEALARRRRFVGRFGSIALADVFRVA